jgi:uncharacterized protein (TIGR02118 family)
MVRLIALFDRPEDTDSFDAHYRDVHAPIVRRYPGLRELRVTRPAAVGRSTAPYLVAEMVFDTRAELDAALVSEPGIESGRDLRSFAGAGVTMFIADDDSAFDA